MANGHSNGFRDGHNVWSQAGVSNVGPVFGALANLRIAEDQEEFHRHWIELFTDRDQGPAAAQWALAWFALDNTLHRACHLGADAASLRLVNPNCQEVENQIQQSVKKLMETHRQWKQRKIVEEAEEMEKKGELFKMMNPTAQSNSTPFATFPLDMSAILPSTNPRPSSDSPTSPSLAFLQYPQVTLINHFYANLLNHYRSIEIYLTLITRPNWGTLEPTRFQCAIELCRTHAALGEERNFLTTGKIWGLWLCGITFGGPELYPVLPPSSPSFPPPLPPQFRVLHLSTLGGFGANVQRESQWVLDRLEDIGTFFYAASLTAKMLRIMWRIKGNYWDSTSKIHFAREEREDEVEEVS